MKIGYEKLKSSNNSGIERTFETVELIVYLYKLSISTFNLSEARYFLKQILHLSETTRSQSTRQLAERLKLELSVLMGNSFSFVDYEKCEIILRSSQIFHFEHKVKVVGFSPTFSSLIFLFYVCMYFTESN